MKILFLYSELAGYAVNCFKETMKLYPDVEIFVVRWPINKEAPFKFDFGKVNVVEKDEVPQADLLKYTAKVAPDAIVASGWMDKDYNEVCKAYVKKIPVILTIDNHWRGDLKQVIASNLSRYLVRNKFNRVWVPGKKQYKFAKKLGFKKELIQTGFYSADVKLFKEFGDASDPYKNVSYPKRFLYVGRYVEHKGIFDIWNAFVEIQNENPNDWELWSVGTGDQWDNRVKHTKVKHLGFVQPDDFQEIINQTGVYILPSHFEPWGVSLHEFVAAGFPVLVSDKVGSGEVFCDESKNGFVFKAGDKAEIKSTMQKMMSVGQQEFTEMQSYSRSLSLSITPEIWANTLIKLSNG